MWLILYFFSLLFADITTSRVMFLLFCSFRNEGVEPIIMVVEAIIKHMANKCIVSIRKNTAINIPSYTWIYFFVSSFFMVYGHMEHAVHVLLLSSWFSWDEFIPGKFFLIGCSWGSYFIDWLLYLMVTMEFLMFGADIISILGLFLVKLVAIVEQFKEF